MVVVVGTWEENSGSTAIGNDLTTTEVGAGYLTITLVYVAGAQSDAKPARLTSHL